MALYKDKLWGIICLLKWSQAQSVNLALNGD